MPRSQLRCHAEILRADTLSWAVAGGQVGRMVETVHPRGHSKVKGSVHPMPEHLNVPRSTRVPRRTTKREWRQLTRYPLTALRRRALAITDTDEKLMARAATRGLRNQPVRGYSTPAASGIPRAL